MSSYRSSPVPESLPSSPPAGSCSPPRNSSQRERGAPSVTPRRFNRFWTPRSLQLPGRRILGDLDSRSTNRQPLDSDPFSSPTAGRENERKRHGDEDVQSSASKRYRGYATQDDSPIQKRFAEPAATEMRAPSETDLFPSAKRSKRPVTLHSPSTKNDWASIGYAPVKNIRVADTRVRAPQGYEPRSVGRFCNQGFEAELLNREHCFSRTTLRAHSAAISHDWRESTANYYSSGSSWAKCESTQGAPMIPFALASCHQQSNLGTAVGDESGNVHWFSPSEFNEQEAAWKPVSGRDAPVWKLLNTQQIHENAIMDMDISADDLRLATACGDRTGSIIDIATQTVAITLDGGHYNSMRQVKFQPGTANGSVLASSDRDGRMRIWDLRCSPVPVRAFSESSNNLRDTTLPPVNAKFRNSLESGYTRSSGSSGASVTALQWFPTGREHFLLSGSEAGAQIKLWDTRYIKRRGDHQDTPVSITAPPSQHSRRKWGITSLTLSTDAARLYSVCKDGNVYVYSMAHLLLGEALQFEDASYKPRPKGVSGLGPLYGLTHDQLSVSTFYTKCSLRPASDRHSEMLAVGSGNHCAILFPTSEKLLPLSTPTFDTQPQETPIYKNIGTPLIRGHLNEVTSVSWSPDGGLITASDDSIVRRWTEQPNEARHMRTVGEFGGERWMKGWADVGEGFDRDEDGSDDVE